jgi:hypothetical protein
LFSLFRKQQQQNCLRRQVRFSIAILILIPLVKLNEKFKRDTRGDKRELARLGWNRKKKKSRTIGCHRLAPFHLTAVKPQKKKKKVSFPPRSIPSSFTGVCCVHTGNSAAVSFPMSPTHQTTGQMLLSVCIKRDQTEKDREKILKKEG